MTDLTWPPVPVDDMALERKPRKCRHRWVTASISVENGVTLNPPKVQQQCVRCNRIADMERVRRGKSSRRLGGDGERRSEKRYGWRKVGEYGGIDDLSGSLAVVQQKTTRAPVPARWRTVFAALEVRAAGRIPLILISHVRAGIDTEDFILIRGRDWLQLHGRDEPR